MNFVVTSPYTIRVVLKNNKGEVLNDSTMQVVAYGFDPDAQAHQIHVLDKHGFTLSLSDWAEEAAARIGAKDIYKYDVEIIK